ncbi:hypothetical protein [Streptomyces hygroscopicus]|uniref:hypothetical protein n=1 Tax=Streptomyces hygroscopicus TaxID=1912 RepID=UPI0007675E36|nr:hypothetical protein [Streptomyces hygroscopicus]
MKPGKDGVRAPSSDSLASGSDRTSSSACPWTSSTSEASDAISAEDAAAGGGQALEKPCGSGASGTATGAPVGGGGGAPAPALAPNPPEPPVDVGAVEAGEDDDEAFWVYQAGGV